MARFDVVHRHVVIPDNLRPGDIYNFILREPRKDIMQGHSTSNYYVVSVTIDNQTGKLIPADAISARVIADWKRRHTTTEEWEF